MIFFSEAGDVLDSLYGYLKITYKLIEKRGPDINVSEKFKVRFTVRNASPHPNIWFNKPTISIRGTAYAHPSDGPVSQSLGATLSPGQFQNVEVDMIADGDIAGWLDFFMAEPVARVTVKAILDINRLSQTYNSRTAYIEIAP